MFSSEHLSIVHSNGSPQGSPLWAQAPSAQVSVPLQKMSSLQGLPSGWLMSAGHCAAEPVQFSAWSQTSADARHTWLDGANASAGQSFPPLQLSATSQTPADARQTAVLLASVGHVAPLPVQFSARSHTPAEPRHTVLDGANPSAGQSFVVPLQLSATSQIPADARHSAVL